MPDMYAVPLAEMPEFVQEFAAYKVGIQNCSPKTVSEYLLDLRTFFRYIVASRSGIDPDSDEFCEIDISTLDLEFAGSVRTTEIYAFLQYSGTVRKNMWAAKARKLVSVRMLYRYLVNKTHRLKNNPAADIEAPKPRRSLPKFLSLEESITLLDAVKNDAESKTIERDYAIITLFLNCGMRVSELVGIDLNDIQRDMTSLRVTGKGAKERVIYLNDACREALDRYLAVRSEIAPPRTTAMFLSNRRTRISCDSVQVMVKKNLTRAGLDASQYSTHKLRHTAATLMLQNGVDVRTLQEVLGHEHLNTTQIYTHVDNDQLRTAAAANPLGEFSPDENVVKKNSDS